MVGSWLLSMLGLDGVTELFNFTHVGTKELSTFSVLECITYWHFHKEVEGILQVSVNAIFHACKFISLSREVNSRLYLAPEHTECTCIQGMVMAFPLRSHY